MQLPVLLRDAPCLSPRGRPQGEAEQLGAAPNTWVRALLMGQGFQGSTAGEKICGSCMPSLVQCPESALNAP